jgi:hypothetical protein
MEIAPAEKVSGKAPATLQATAPSKKTIHFVAAFVLVAALTACVGVLIAGGGGGGGGSSSSTVVVDGEYWTCSDDPYCCAEEGGTCACSEYAAYGSNGLARAASARSPRDTPPVTRTRA